MVVIDVRAIFVLFSVFSFFIGTGMQTVLKCTVCAEVIFLSTWCFDGGFIMSKEERKLDFTMWGSSFGGGSSCRGRVNWPIVCNGYNVANCNTSGRSLCK